VKKGYCGIGIQNIKSEVNYGTLFRSALILGSDFIFLIGKRFKKQSSNTTQSQRHIPLFEYESTEQFLSYGIPYDCRLIGVEMIPEAKLLPQFQHPERAIYVLGAEDYGLSKELQNKCQAIIQIPGYQCLNVAVAGSIVLYDRATKYLKEE